MLWIILLNLQVISLVSLVSLFSLFSLKSQSAGYFCEKDFRGDCLYRMIRFGKA